MVGRRALFREIVVGVHVAFCQPEAESSEALDDVPDRFGSVMDALVDRCALAERELPGDSVAPAERAVADLPCRLRYHLCENVLIEPQLEDERACAFLEGEPQVDPPGDVVERLSVAMEEVVAPITMPCVKVPRTSRLRRRL